MRALYIECNMGAAGDMLTAALSELSEKKDKTADILNGLDIPKVRFEKEYKKSCGISGAHMHVLIDGEEEKSEDVHDHHHHHSEDAHEHHDHHHHSLSDIERIIGGLQVSEKVKKDILGIYTIIAEAESEVHGREVSKIHFHEVGAMDAIADVTAVCVLMEELNVDKVICSPVHVGSGNVRCEHGVLPVPAPATANILKGIPIYSNGIKGELCTPTGAAILKYFADEFGEMPVMNIEEIGVGVGNKEFEAANIVRVFLGDMTDDKKKNIVELNCNIDDATGEELGYAVNMLMDRGALDAFIVPIQMKKSRPGQMLVVMSTEEKAEELAELMLKHTTTLGVRKKICERITMDRSIEKVSTNYGEVRIKKATYKDIEKSKPEYEDIARISKETGKSIREIINSLEVF